MARRGYASGTPVEDVSAPPRAEGPAPGGRVRGDATYEDLVTAVLIAHQRRVAGPCLCGWDELGRSHARHVARVLRAAGALRG